MAKLCSFRGPWTDSSGVALDSGLIYTYQTGTTTPKNTYTDTSESTLLPNPIVLDSNGCKEVYLLTDTAYRFIIKTSGGTVVGNTIDEVTPLTAFASLSGGTNVDISDYALITQASKDLHITPGTSGNLYFGDIKWPVTSPSANQVLLVTDSTTLTWGSPNTGTLFSDSAPKLSANLDTNGFDIEINTTGGFIDENANEQLIFNTTAAAANYLTITNSAAASSPSLKAAGSDTNVALTINGKGSGGVAIDAAAISGVATVGSTLGVTGATTLSSTLAVTGATTLSSTLAAGNTTITGTAAVSSNATVGGTLGVTGATTITGALTADGLAYPTSDGDANDIVTTNGSGTLSLAKPNYRLVASGSLSGASTTISSIASFSKLQVVIVDVTCVTGNPSLEFRVSSDNGSTWVAIGGAYIKVDSAGSVSGLAYTSPDIRLSGSIDGSVKSGFTCDIDQPSTTFGVFSAAGTGYNGTSRATYQCTSVLQASAKINAVRIAVSSSTFSGGIYAVYALA